MYWVGYLQAAHTYPIPNWIGFIERLKEQVILHIAWKKYGCTGFTGFRDSCSNQSLVGSSSGAHDFHHWIVGAPPQNVDSFGYTVTCRTCIATLWAMATIGYPIPSPKVGYAAKTR